MGFMDSLFGGSSQSSSSQIAPDQLPFLTDLWTQGQGLMNQQMGPVGQQAGQMGADLYGQGQGFLQTLQGIGTPTPYAPSQAATGQIGALGDILNTQAGRLANTVGINAVGAGQYGQGRGEVARGIIAGDTQQALSSGAGQIMGQDMRNQTAQMGIQAQSALGGLSSLNSLYGLGMSPFQSAWMPLAMQQGLVGSPAILGQSSGSLTGGLISGLGGGTGIANLGLAFL